MCREDSGDDAIAESVRESVAGVDAVWEGVTTNTSGCRVSHGVFNNERISTVPVTQPLGPFGYGRKV